MKSSVAARSLELSHETFRELAHDLVDFAADHLRELPQLPCYPGDATGEMMNSLFGGDIPLAGTGAAAFKSLSQVFVYSRPASPRFFGYVFGSGEPVGVLGEFAAGVLHQNCTAWRSSPAAITIERTVVRWLAEAVGCDAFSGSLTLGGSAANLMGLCMAREAKLPANQTGARGGVIYCSTEAHMSIPKAAALLGLGHEGVRLVPVDDEFRMKAEDLRNAITGDLQSGHVPVAVVASAGTTATGSIDPLIAIADICQEFELWLHVDGAYGALASLAIPDAFRGLSRADSLSLDPHKWLYQPTGCGCLLYRDRSAARRAFAHSGEYAKVLSEDPVEGFSFFEESMELSRPFRALSLWLSLRYHGLHAFQESIREDLHYAQRLAQYIDEEPTLERLAPVALSAVCFRYVGDGNGDLNSLNRAILAKVVKRGRVYLSNAIIHDQFALRACIVNHRSTEADVRSVVTEVLEVGDELSGEHRSSGA
jgi:glutamate/tyrosine decarboxylase-like PLP-dependent enzyme